MADTVVNTLYPPLIETFQPAFLYDNPAIITFSLSPFNSISDITNIHVSVVDQRNNSNVLKQNLTYQKQTQPNTNGETVEFYYGITNGLLIAEIPTFDKTSLFKQKQGMFQYDPIRDLYAISLSPEDLLSENDYWNNNQYYQVQIRFDRNTANWHSDKIAFATYMLENREYFSEWSSVTLIKPILEPVLSIAQLNSQEKKYTYPGSFHISGTVVFNQPGNKNGLTYPETEHLQSYRIIVTNNANSNVKDSDWIYARQNTDSENNTTIDYLLDLSNNSVGDILTVTIYCKTNNGYIFNQEYTLELNSYTTWLKNIKWNSLGLNNDIIEVNQEDGVAKIRFSAEKGDTGFAKSVFYFKRACSKDDFKTWDLIYRYDYVNTPNTIEIPFDDYSIASLYQYKYSVQVCVLDNGESWGAIHLSDTIYSKFYEMLLMRQHQQIAIRYNGQVSSWKPTVNRQKIDTLGGRYPKFVENAAMNYKTYQISGLISAEEDFNRKFLDENEDNNVGYYDEEFGEQYLIRNDTAADGNIKYNDKRNQQIRKTINNSVKVGKDLYAKNDFSGELNNQHDTYPHNHWYWEREFREQLVAWLNDGEPKLYRSMPEGNLIVMLTDINLTPDTQLGRMLYNFSATMYEVGNGYSIEELDNLGVINIPNPDAVFLTDSLDDEDTDAALPGTVHTITKYFTITSDSAMNNWVSGTTDSHNTSNLWDDMSVLEQLNEYHVQQKETVNGSSIKLSNINIQFTSPPHYYTYDNTTGKFTLSLDNTGMIEQETEWLGYIIQLSSGTTAGNLQQIFINERGFYHVPDSTIIKNIQVLNGQADIMCECEYRAVTDNANKQLSEPVFQRTIVGQYTDDSLPLKTDIIPLILERYAKTEYRNGMLISKTYLNSCKGLLLDVTPYTCIKYNDDDTTTDYELVVGQTGIFNAFENWSLNSLQILGRKMIKVTSYPYHIEEWQYYIDNTGSPTNPKINGVYTINGNTQIYYIDGMWYPINTTSGIAEVPIYGMINYHGDLLKRSV